MATAANPHEFSWRCSYCRKEVKNLTRGRSNATCPSRVHLAGVSMPHEWVHTATGEIDSARSKLGFEYCEFHMRLERVGEMCGWTEYMYGVGESEEEKKARLEPPEPPILEEYE